MTEKKFLNFHISFIFVKTYSYLVEGRNDTFSHATYLALELFASQSQDQVLNSDVETLHLGIEHYRDVTLEL